MPLDDRKDQTALEEFIQDSEAKWFRTASDVGANTNALFVWNRVRDFAGLPALTNQDLRDKEPEVAKFHDLKAKYEQEKWSFAFDNFPHFGEWLKDN